jgi:hypothetical protein
MPPPRPPSDGAHDDAPEPGERTREVLLELAYEDFAELSKSTEDAKRGVDRLVTVLTDLDDEYADAFAEGLAKVAELIGLNLGRIAMAQDRLRKHGITGETDE